MKFVAICYVEVQVGVDNMLFRSRQLIRWGFRDTGNSLYLHSKHVSIYHYLSLKKTTLLFYVVPMGMSAVPMGCPPPIPIRVYGLQPATVIILGMGR